MRAPIPWGFFIHTGFRAEAGFVPASALGVRRGAKKAQIEQASYNERVQWLVTSYS